MFRSEQQIKARTGQNKVGRYPYLKLLVDEFRTSKSTESKHEVIANLANFAYDPINYEHLRSLGVVDLFMEQLSENDGSLKRFGLGGLCNLALDKENKEYINNSGGLPHISNCLHSTCNETIMYAITTLMFLTTPTHKHEIISDRNVERMVELSDHKDKRIQNLAVIFLEDYCSRDQVQRLRSTYIPLPPSPPPPSTSNQQSTQ